MSANLYVRANLDVTHIEQILQNQIRFILCHTVDAASEALVDEDALPARHRCSALA